MRKMLRGVLDPEMHFSPRNLILCRHSHSFGLLPSMVIDALDRGLGMEVCTTLGMLTPEQARELRQAGLTAYNHNLDTSPEYYSKA